MNDIDSKKRGHVIPKWIDLQSASNKNEILIPRAVPFEINKATKNSVEMALQEFKEHPSIDNSSYLLCASLVTSDITLAHDMASFIKDQHNAGKVVLDLADKVLDAVEIDITSFNHDLKIAKIKKWVAQYPKSAVAWMELGRLYTIKGQQEKARRAVLVALNLAPFDRYIVRCGVRFFLHIFDFDTAWHFINTANKHIKDPWLKATEINVAIISQKSIPPFMTVLPKDPKGSNIFYYSELYESYGMLELISGNNQKAKKQFKIAWSDPAEAVITHGEWIIRNKFPGLKDSIKFEYNKSLEALMWVQYSNLDFITAMDTAEQWQNEEPYSRSPFIMGAYIACNAGLPNEGVEIAKKGLIANPNDSRILNNLCYALLKAGRVKEAEEDFKRYDQVTIKSERVFYLATKGLLEFKKGNSNIGRGLYLEAMEKCKQDQSDELFAKAYLNLALAEIEASGPESIKTARKALIVSKGINQPDIKLFRQELEKKISVLNTKSIDS